MYFCLVSEFFVLFFRPPTTCQMGEFVIIDCGNDDIGGDIVDVDNDIIIIMILIL